jgi:hypothetical protein
LRFIISSAPLAGALLCKALAIPAGDGESLFSSPFTLVDTWADESPGGTGAYLPSRNRCAPGKHCIARDPEAAQG